MEPYQILLGVQSASLFLSTPAGGVQGAPVDLEQSGSGINWLQMDSNAVGYTRK